MNSVKSKSYGWHNVKNHYGYSDLDLWPVTLGQGCDFLWSGVTILWIIILIHAFSGNLWPRQCLNHYEHSDLDLWTITLEQGHYTFLSPGQQSCEILFKFIKRIKSYGPDKLFAYVLTIMCIMTLTFDQWSWIKVMTLSWIQCNNSVKYYCNQCFQCKIMARTMFKPLCA